MFDRIYKLAANTHHEGVCHAKRSLSADAVENRTGWLKHNLLSRVHHSAAAVIFVAAAVEQAVSCFFNGIIACRSDFKEREPNDAVWDRAYTTCVSVQMVILSAAGAIVHPKIAEWGSKDLFEYSSFDSKDTPLERLFLWLSDD